MDSRMTVLEAAQFLGCHPASLRLWARQGRVKHTKFGRALAFTKTDLREFQRKREEAKRQTKLAL